MGDDELAYTLSRAEGEELGDYEISVAVVTDPDANPDYQVTTVPGTFTIVKAKLPVEDLPDGQRVQPKKDVYTGEPQPLVTPPEELPDGCEKVLYSTDDGETWTEDVPTGTDVGDYPVKVRYVGDENHEDAYEDITGSIEKAPGDKDGLTDFQKPKAVEGIVTDGTPQVLVVPPVGLPQGYEKVQYSLDGGKTWSDELPTASLPGDYTVSVRYVGDANHADMLGDDIPVTVTAIPSYACTSGDGSDWAKGGGDGLAFTFERQMVGEDEDLTFVHFASASVDGKELVRDVDYTAVEGSVVLTLAPAFLDALAEGGHTLTATFDDGSAEATFTVAAAPQGAEPAAAKTRPASGVAKTGDAVPVAACLAIIVLAVGALLVARRKMG